ncbi:MAG: hypothetical protein II835_00135, partial [Fibrobacter sp.]|nr:hypothetical protein [Fibrobacter sp.]
LNTAFSIKARILSPIASDSIKKDSVSARFKATFTSGPERLRPSLSATCLEASDNCRTTEWKGIIESTWEQFSFKAGANLRYDRTNSTKLPKIELGATYHANSATAKLTVAFPESTPVNGISVQNEVKFDAEPLGCDFVFAFKKTKTKPFKPNFAHIQAILKF